MSPGSRRRAVRAVGHFPGAHGSHSASVTGAAWARFRLAALMAAPQSLPHPSRRRLLKATGLAALLAGCGAPPATAPAVRNPALRLIGETRLPHRLRFEGTTVGGLSGLDYDPARDLWYAVSDDRSAPHFYTLRLPITAGQVGP
jgi:hypothetical protein